MLINVIMRKNFGLVFMLSKTKKKKKICNTIAGEAVGKRVCLNIPEAKGTLFHLFILKIHVI